MHGFLHRFVVCLALLLGALGVFLKVEMQVEPDRVAGRFMHSDVADLAMVLPLSNRGPYDAYLYKGRGCLGEIWLLPLHRNGDAASLLPDVQGFLLDGQRSDGFPAMAHAVGQVARLIGLRDTAPQVLAFAETGGCDLLARVTVAAS